MSDPFELVDRLMEQRTRSTRKRKDTNDLGYSSSSGRITGLGTIARQAQSPVQQIGATASRWLGGVGDARTAADAAHRAGFRGDDLARMVAIAQRESGFDPTAQNLKGLDHSIGLWQINQLAHKGRFGSDQELMDPYANARAAYSLFQSGGYQPWSTYTNNSYLSYLPTARALVQQLYGG